jgi:CRISPR-associated protein Csm2
MEYLKEMPNNNELRQIVKKIIEGDTKQMIEWAAKFGYRWGAENSYLYKGNKERKNPKDERLTTAQIRNVFGSVKKMEMAGFNDQTIKQLILLKPKLAYAAGKPGKKKGTEELRDVLTPAIDYVTDEDTFVNFCNFFEAILAYHRAAGGK